MSLPSDAIQTLLTGDPERVLQALLQAYPERAQDILDAVSQLGLEDAIRVILEQPEQGPTPGPAQLPEVPATGATPQVGKAVRGISSALGDMPAPERKPSEVGVGSRPSTSVTTSNINEPDLSAPTPEISVTPRPQPGLPPAGATPTTSLPTISDARNTPEKNIQPITKPDEGVESPKQPPDIISQLLGLSPFPQITQTQPDAYDKFLKEFQKVCADNRIPMPVALAIMKKESQFNPSAVGDAGELGIMQLMPGTARQIGLQVTTQNDDRSNTKKNINGGLRYLNWIQRSYKTQTLDDMLGAYNAGPSRLKHNTRGQPKWKEIRSTVDYVETIKSFVKTYEKDPQTMQEDLQKLHGVSGG